MPAWIKVVGDINAAYKPLLVLSSEEATRLKEGDAQQVTRSATDEYRSYRWRVVRIMGFDECIVEGIEKTKK
jgi:hypothetical protein